MKEENVLLKNEVQIYKEEIEELKKMFYEFAYHEEIKELKINKNDIIEIKNNIKKLEKIIPVNENKINN